MARRKTYRRRSGRKSRKSRTKRRSSGGGIFHNIFQGLQKAKRSLRGLKSSERQTALKTPVGHITRHRTPPLMPSFSVGSYARTPLLKTYQTEQPRTVSKRKHLRWAVTPPRATVASTRAYPKSVGWTIPNKANFATLNADLDEVRIRPKKGIAFTIPHKANFNAIYD